MKMTVIAVVEAGHVATSLSSNTSGGCEEILESCELSFLVPDFCIVQVSLEFSCVLSVGLFNSLIGSSHLAADSSSLSGIEVIKIKHAVRFFDALNELLTRTLASSCSVFFSYAINVVVVLIFYPFAPWKLIEHPLSQADLGS
jgi:hypothetical protein